MMLELVAEKLTACFDKRLTLSEIERLKMILGFESLLHQFVLIGIIIIFACVLEIVRPVTLFLAVFGTYRTFAGGFHLSTSLRCTIATTAIMIIGTKLALAISMKIGATFLIWAVILVIVWFYVPRLTSNHPIEQETIQKTKGKDGMAGRAFGDYCCDKSVGNKRNYFDGSYDRNIYIDTKTRMIETIWSLNIIEIAVINYR